MQVTVFTPTYNRAALIHRVFDSLVEQTCKDFEWLIMDDGSTDDTENIVREFSRSAQFPVIYEKRLNKGKVASINEGLYLARGEFFLVFDSDDWCMPNAIERFLEVWESVPATEEYCAVSALKAYPNGKLVGESYARMATFGESYIDRFSRRVRGDKWEFIRTSAHRECLYHLGENERYQAPEYAWLALSEKAKTVFLDEVLSIVEYQPDGISKNNLQHRVDSPISAYRFYQRGRHCAREWRFKMRCELNAVRFACHAKRFSLLSSFGPVAACGGVLMYVRDKIVKRL